MLSTSPSGLCCTYHLDAMMWKHFPHSWPFQLWEEFSSEFPSQSDEKAELYMIVSPNMLLNKLLSSQWFKRPWGSCHDVCDVVLAHCNMFTGICQKCDPQYEWNWLVPRLTQCISPISHNAPLCNRNVHMCAHVDLYSELRITCRIVSGLATDSPRHVWCRGWTTYLLCGGLLSSWWFWMTVL